MADAATMHLIAQGDTDAFATLYDRYAPDALALATRITRKRDAAEDVVQEAFVEVWRNAARYIPERGSAINFILGITRFRALDSLRREGLHAKRRAGSELLEHTQEAPERTDLEVDRRLEAAWIRSVLGRLPSSQGKAIELAYFAGLTHREIGARLDLPVGTVKGRIRLGLDKLRGELLQGEAA